MGQATKITEQIYLGPLSVARDLSTLEQLQISAIVCAAAEGIPHFPDKFDYFEMDEPPVEHSCGIEDIIKSLNSIWDFVSAKLDDDDDDGKGRVFVHCVHGRTRSASIVTFLLAKQNNCTIQEAYSLVASKRDIFVPEEWLDALQTKLSQEQNVE